MHTLGSQCVYISGILKPDHLPRDYTGYMFRLLNSHLQAYSIQVKSQDAVHTLGSQCVYISGILKPDHVSRKCKRTKCVTEWLNVF